jgi:hypothetical protein
MYEDRDSQELNARLKAEVRARIRAERLERALAVVPVADLRRYDYWPARAVVRRAVVERARELGTEILLDWRGDLARRYGFRSPGSNVVLIGHQGALLYQRFGPLDGPERLRFHQTLARALAARTGATPSRPGGKIG